MESFHHSISSKLFKEAIEFARHLIQISGDDLSIIMQARRVLPFEGTTPWIKKRGDEDFDVPVDQ